MIILDDEIVVQCSNIYNMVSGFDYFDDGQDDGICWAIKHYDDVDLVILRGSTIVEDWYRDAQAIDIETSIGHVHSGFYTGMDHMWVDLKPRLQKPCIVSGHSLGAARASILTALMIQDNLAPIARVAFGEPKPGMLDHALIVNKIPGRSYRNGSELHHDLVTDVPFSIPPFQYVHPTPIIHILCEPKVNQFEQFGIFAYHHIYLYETAVKNYIQKGNI